MSELPFTFGQQRWSHFQGNASGDLKCLGRYIKYSTNQQFCWQQFQGQHGQAYLFRYVVNVSEGPEKEKQMTTGKHTITTVFCCQCDTEVGWRYVSARL
jgi:hypothetical protein